MSKKFNISVIEYNKKSMTSTRKWWVWYWMLSTKTFKIGKNNRVLLLLTTILENAVIPFPLYLWNKPNKSQHSTRTYETVMADPRNRNQLEQSHKYIFFLQNNTLKKRVLKWKV